MLKLVHRGFEAFISCDDANLEVHRASVAGAVASGWIASEPGRAFKITVNQTRPETHFTLRVHLDGKRVEYLVTPSWQMRTLSTDGARPSPTTFTPFVFAAPLPASASSHNTASDDEDEEEEEAEAPDEATLREIGTIRLEVARVVLGTVYASTSTRTGGLSPADVVRKRALGQHHIALGAERPGAPWIMRNWSVAPVDPRKPGPEAVFEFRYRPREFLHANGIIPRPKRVREHRLDTLDDEAVERSTKVARINADDSAQSMITSEIQTCASITDVASAPPASSAVDCSSSVGLVEPVNDTSRGSLPNTPRVDPVALCA